MNCYRINKSDLFISTLYSEPARDAGISVDTSKRYLEYLKISYQAMMLQPYGANITGSAVRTPKIYWLDLGLLRQMTGFWCGGLLTYNGDRIGKIAEPGIRMIPSRRLFGN